MDNIPISRATSAGGSISSTDKIRPPAQGVGQTQTDAPRLGKAASSRVQTTQLTEEQLFAIEQHVPIQILQNPQLLKAEWAWKLLLMQNLFQEQSTTTTGSDTALYETHAPRQVGNQVPPEESSSSAGSESSSGSPNLQSDINARGHDNLVSDSRTSTVPNESVDSWRTFDARDGVGAGQERAGRGETNVGQVPDDAFDDSDVWQALDVNDFGGTRESSNGNGKFNFQQANLREDADNTNIQTSSNALTSSGGQNPDETEQISTSQLSQSHISMEHPVDSQSPSDGPAPVFRSESSTSEAAASSPESTLESASFQASTRQSPSPPLNQQPNVAETLQLQFETVVRQLWSALTAGLPRSGHESLSMSMDFQTDPPLLPFSAMTHETIAQASSKTDEQKLTNWVIQDRLTAGVVDHPYERSGAGLVFIDPPQQPDKPPYRAVKWRAHRQTRMGSGGKLIHRIRLDLEFQGQGVTCVITAQRPQLFVHFLSNHTRLLDHLQNGPKVVTEPLAKCGWELIGWTVGRPDDEADKEEGR